MQSRNIQLRKLRNDFLESKESLKYSSYRAYKFPTKHFIEHLEANGVDGTQQIDPYHIEQWMRTRKNEGIAKTTLRTNVKKIKTFIRWAEKKKLVQDGLSDSFDPPEIPKSEQASHDHLSSEEADALLDYLNTYHYASRRHALIAVLWHTGCRISGAIALDVKDFDAQKQVLRFRDRTDTGTNLKLGYDSERNATLQEKFVRILNDYISNQRHNVTDEYGRKPLFCTKDQRLTRQRAYKNISAYTRPCWYSNDCPHGYQIETCEWSQKKSNAFGCPGSVSSHPIRRGSITHHLNSGWPKEKVSDRCNVSIETLDKHYNEQTKEDEREQRKQFIDNL